MLYHITHVDNLSSIIRDGVLLSDALMTSRGGPTAVVGMSTIKRRRLILPVRCHPGDCVGEYVPFYFCPRSIMLYVIHCANQAELNYRGGQGPIIHLEADLHEVVEWAQAHGRRWAFTTSNAGAVYAKFQASLAELDQVDWSAVAATDFRHRDVQEGKQAEFLIRDSLPWELVRRIGVHSAGIRARVEEALGVARHRPRIETRPDWYY